MHLEINPDPSYEPQTPLFGDCMTEQMQVGRRNKFLLLVSWQALLCFQEKSGPIPLPTQVLVRAKGEHLLKG